MSVIFPRTINGQSQQAVAFNRKYTSPAMITAMFRLLDVMPSCRTASRILNGFCKGWEPSLADVEDALNQYQEAFGGLPAYRYGADVQELKPRQKGELRGWMPKPGQSNQDFVFEKADFWSTLIAAELDGRKWSPDDFETRTGEELPIKIGGDSATASSPVLSPEPAPTTGTISHAEVERMIVEMEGRIMTAIRASEDRIIAALTRAKGVAWRVAA